MDGKKRVEYIDFPKVLAEGIPETHWVIEGWIAKGEIVTVAGPPKSGKTNTVAHMVQHVVLGRDWFGAKVSGKFKVLCFDEEQPERTAVRTVARIAAGLGAEPWAEGLMVAIGQGIRLNTRQGLELLEAEIEAHRPDVVVLDSFAKVTAGTDENSNSEMARVGGEIVRLRNEYDCTFVCLHHTTKDAFEGAAKGKRMSKVRGGGELIGNSDVLIWAQMKKGTPPQEFSIETRRDSDTLDFPTLWIHRRTDDDSTTSPVTLVLDDSPEPLDDVTAALLEQAKQAQLDALRRSEEPMSTGELNKLAGTGEKTAQRARKALVREGLIESLRKGLWQITEQDTLTDGGEAA